MNKIDINGYKSIKELKLKLQPINILIGANGSGKSNFLSFFDFLKHSKGKWARQPFILSDWQAFWTAF